jgi:Fe-S-cluster containining protein
VPRVFNKVKMERRIQSEWKPFEAGMRWKCIRCGQCCSSNWSIDLTWIEYERIMSLYRDRPHPEYERELDTETGLDHPYFLIKDICPYLDVDGTACSLHPDWFYTCATYPFLLSPEGGIMYHTECKGLGHGNVVMMEDMKRKILEERKKAGMIGKDE